jgi:hypothetical protein
LGFPPELSVFQPLYGKFSAKRAETGFPEFSTVWVLAPYNMAILAQRIEKVKLAAFAVDECKKSTFCTLNPSVPMDR